MSDEFRIDSHKLILHPKRVAAWQEGIESVLENNKNLNQKYEISNSAWEKLKKIYPIYVEISPYGACNHRCTFCGVDYMGYKSIKLDLEIFKKRIKEMGELGIKSVMFAGEGEPLLCASLADMTKATKQAGIDIGITTNFVPAKRENLEILLRNCAWIKTSINAGDAETYAKIHRTKEADFKKVLENLALAVKMREEIESSYIESSAAKNLDSIESKNHKIPKCTLGAQMLLLPQNAHTALNLAQTCAKIGLDYLVIKPYSQHLFSNTREYENTSYTEFEALNNALSTLNSDKFKVIFRANTMERAAKTKSYQKCLSTPFFWGYISANGDIYGCSCYLGQEQWKLGNINEQSFKEIWESEKRRKNLEYILQNLDISQCRTNCRMDAINEYLWELLHPNSHANFI